jgi:hypothetical protein
MSEIEKTPYVKLSGADKEREMEELELWNENDVKN